MAKYRIAMHLRNELVSIMSWHLLRPLGRWSAIGHANGPPTAGMDQQRSWRRESAQAAQAVCIKLSFVIVCSDSDASVQEPYSAIVCKAKAC